MSGISERFGFGGANVVPGGSGGDPTLAATLRDIADDLQGHQVPAILSADASDLGTAQTLVNEIKAKLNSIAPAQGSVLGTAQGPFDIEPAQTLTVDVDAGGPVAATFDAAAGVLDGDAGTYDFSEVDGPGMTIRIKLDNGVEIETVFEDADFSTNNAATAAEVAAAINADHSGTPASDAAGTIRITSPTRGADGRVQVVGGNARSALGYGDSNNDVSGTGDVGDIDAVTIEEVKKVVEADVAGSEVLDVDGRIMVRTATSGASGSIAVTGGTASAAMGLTDTAVFIGTTATPSKTFKALD